jgi:MFS family permease
MFSHNMTMTETTTSTRLGSIYLVEAILSAAATLLISGIFFFTRNHLHWTLQQNFLLAIGQGIIYIGGALMADRLRRRLGTRGILLTTQSLIVVFTLSASLASDARLLVGCLLCYTGLMANNWPVLESLVSVGNAHQMSRRIGIYNLLWAGTGAISFAFSGVLIEHCPMGFFLVPAILHAAAIWLIIFFPPSTSQVAHGHVAPEARLEQQRRLALWLSRIALPATYLIIYGLMALFPSLPIMKNLSPTQQTLLSSVWFAARWVVFLFLGATVWWHTRPRLLLAAAFILLLAFLGITLQFTDSMGINLLTMILCQVALGIAIGWIYSASLYFGMVLSKGSTEHGGYHEALIGLGQILGPAAGAAAQWIHPGDARYSVMAVAAITAVSVLAATMANFMSGSEAE